MADLAALQSAMNVERAQTEQMQTAEITQSLQEDMSLSPPDGGDLEAFNRALAAAKPGATEVPPGTLAE